MGAKNNKGYTLIEVIIVIVLIGLATTLVGYGFSLINRSNVNAYSNAYIADLRYAKNQSMTLENVSYYIDWKYDSSDQYYYYELHKSDLASATDQLIKTVKVYKNITVNYDDKGVYFGPLKDYTVAPVIMKITFEATSGDLYLGIGGGTYEFLNVSGDTVSVDIVASTGRVFLNE